MSIKNIFILFLLFTILSCEKKVNAPLPIANFYVAISECNIEECEVAFFDNSENGTGWKWIVDGKTISNLQNFKVSLKKNKGYSIKLIVSNIDNVSSEKIKKITI